MQERFLFYDCIVTEPLPIFGHEAMSTTVLGNKDGWCFISFDLRTHSGRFHTVFWDVGLWHRIASRGPQRHTRFSASLSCWALSTSPECWLVCLQAAHAWASLLQAQMWSGFRAGNEVGGACSHVKPLWSHCLVTVGDWTCQVWDSVQAQNTPEAGISLALGDMPASPSCWLVLP